MAQYVLRFLDQAFSVCRVKSLSLVNWQDDFVFVSKTDEELSLVCATDSVPANALQREDGWVCFRIEGELDFSLVGILARISSLLAEQNISIFAVSTYGTDYVFIKEAVREVAIATLRENGYPCMT